LGFTPRRRDDAPFIKFKAPLLISHPDRREQSHGRSRLVHQTVINARLKDLHFFRVFDPARAFQEIGMYIGGVLGQQARPIRDIDDETMRGHKGFDKRSFRKMPADAK
jgi:hypothetical protein